MKFFLGLGFLFMAVYNIQAAVSKDEAMAIVTSCKEETGASDADFEAIIKHHSAQTQEGKCLLACFLKKANVMDDAGKVIKHAALDISESLISSEDERALVADIIDICDDIDLSDEHCEAAFEYGECWKKEVKSRGISADHFV
ncbi:general odorant-binding protein 19d-like [Lucilia sericata]|uniref:general odorant-binding protein 19d-like n=1 Tax=Lucilia sericata TaxID=13632 RepID=UPI0018A82628|nr:general odorant-binding protein 19d-like [Lucilia sericata]XP_037827055.1 general odorant-binding protein 19d-like [Lucilia sericata]